MNGIAMLEGLVPTEEVAERVVAIARETPGVRGVVEILRASPAVEPHPGAAPPRGDADLAARVAEALASRVFEEAQVARDADGRTVRVEAPAARVGVRADAGRVRLEGRVGTLAEVGDAVRAARAVPGVTAVSARLFATIEPTNPLAP